MEGYFKKVLDIWGTLKSKSKANKKDMREVIRQFETAIATGELDKNSASVKEMMWKFNEIGRGLV